MVKPKKNSYLIFGVALEALNVLFALKFMFERRRKTKTSSFSAWPVEVGEETEAGLGVFEAASDPPVEDVEALENLEDEDGGPAEDEDDHQHGQHRN